MKSWEKKRTSFQKTKTNTILGILVFFLLRIVTANYLKSLGEINNYDQKKNEILKRKKKNYSL